MEEDLHFLRRGGGGGPAHRHRGRRALPAARPAHGLALRGGGGGRGAGPPAVGGTGPWGAQPSAVGSTPGPWGTRTCEGHPWPVREVGLWGMRTREGYSHLPWGTRTCEGPQPFVVRDMDLWGVQPGLWGIQIREGHLQPSAMGGTDPWGAQPSAVTGMDLWGTRTPEGYSYLPWRAWTREGHSYLLWGAPLACEGHGPVRGTAGPEGPGLVMDIPGPWGAGAAQRVNWGEWVAELLTRVPDLTAGTCHWRNERAGGFWRLGNVPESRRHRWAGL